jgi:hypothetical protein
VVASPHATKPGPYGVTYIPLQMSVEVNGSFGVYEDASAYDGASDTYYAVVAPLSTSVWCGGATQYKGKCGGGANPLYAFCLADGTTRPIPPAGANMPYPFVVVPGAPATAVAFNPARLRSLQNSTFVSINIATGAASALAQGQHVPGLLSDSSLVLDEGRRLIYGIYMQSHDNFLVALDLTNGRLQPPVRVAHVIRFPSVLPGWS